VQVTLSPGTRKSSRSPTVSSAGSSRRSPCRPRPRPAPPEPRSRCWSPGRCSSARRQPAVRWSADALFERQRSGRVGRSRGIRHRRSRWRPRRSRCWGWSRDRVDRSHDAGGRRIVGGRSHRQRAGHAQEAVLTCGSLTPIEESGTLPSSRPRSGRTRRHPPAPPRTTTTGPAAVGPICLSKAMAGFAGVAPSVSEAVPPLTGAPLTRWDTGPLVLA
jgi:hypothetical protein